MRRLLFALFIALALASLAPAQVPEPIQPGKNVPGTFHPYHVVVCLAGKTDLAKYKVPEDSALTVVLYNKLEIVASQAIPGDKLDEKKIEQIKAEVGSKLGAKR
jgi:hypothetical protein